MRVYMTFASKNIHYLHGVFILSGVGAVKV